MKYVVAGIGVVLVIVAVAATVSLAVFNQQSGTVATKPTYLFTLANNEKEKLITTNLTDGRLVRLKLTFELDGDLTPKDMKNPGHEFLALQDSLLRIIRSCRSIDLEPQNQAFFKKAMMDSAAKVFGKESVRGVYITSINFQ